MAVVVEVSLKEYFESRLTDLKTYVETKFDSTKEAVTKAENATEKRFESVNEFRETLNTQQKTFVTRVESDVQTEGLKARLKLLEDAAALKTGEGKGAQNLWAVILAIAGLISIAASIALRFIK